MVPVTTSEFSPAENHLLIRKSLSVAASNIVRQNENLGVIAGVRAGRPPEKKRTWQKLCNRRQRSPKAGRKLS